MTEAERARELTDSGLDRLLAASVVPLPSPGLRARVLAAAPRPRARPRLAGWVLGATLGTGLAAVCAAGVIAGLAAAPLAPDLGGRAAAADPAAEAALQLRDPADVAEV